MMPLDHPIDRTPIDGDVLAVIEHHRVRPELVVVLGQFRELAPRGLFVCTYWTDGTRPRSTVISTDRLETARGFYLDFVQGWLMDPGRPLPERDESRSKRAA